MSLDKNFLDKWTKKDPPQEEPLKVEKPADTEKEEEQKPDFDFAEQAMSAAEKMIDNAPDGEKHSTLLKASHLLGGYVKGGILEWAEAYTCLDTAISLRPNVEDMAAALDTIKKGLKKGGESPFKLEELEADRKEFLSKLGNSRKKKTAAPAPQPEPISPDAFLQKYKHLRITASNPIPAPTPIVTIGEAVISTEGNLTTLSGASKSGKSALSGVILTGAIADPGKAYDGLEGVNIAPNTQEHAVIHIDTEQAMHHHYKNMKYGVLGRVNKDREPPYYHSYNIRELNLPDRLPFVNGLFAVAENAHGGIHLAVIDGIADFLSSPNDEEESNRIVDYFEKLAIMYHCPIIVIVHQNPNSNKQRGHLGSQLQRKSESVLSIGKEGDISYIEPQFLRNAGGEDVPRIMFAYNKEKSYHTFAGIRTESKEGNGISTETYQMWASQVFTNGALKRVDAIKKLEEITDKGNSQCRNYFKALVDSGIIENGKRGAPYDLVREENNEGTKV